MQPPVSVYARGEPGYPLGLQALAAPPEKIWARGPLAWKGASVAIVGTRRASELGLRLAFQFAAGLARAGVAVISGGALGIDRAGHAGALEGGGYTLVVLPTPLTAPAPRSNLPLFEAILARGGAWMTECTSGPTHRGAFCARNRLIAALADLTVVIEAGARSGTHHTVIAARKLGRPVAAVPWTVGDPGGTGCLAILGAGGRAVSRAEDILALIGVPCPRRRRASGAGLTSVLGRALLAVLRGPATAEELSVRTGYDIAEVQSELTLLELADRIGTLAGGRFVRRRP